jgi:hypothetical protein
MPDHRPPTGSPLVRKALSAGSTADGIRMVEHAIWEARQDGLQPRDVPELMDAVEWLGIVYLDEDKPSRAVPPLRDALRVFRRQHGVDHPRVKYLTAHLTAAYRAQGGPVPAIPRRERGYAAALAHGPTSRQAVRSRDKLFNAYWAAGRVRDAFGLFHDALGSCRQTHGPDSDVCVALRHQLAWEYLDVELPDGLPLLERNIVALERTDCPPPTLALRRSELAMVYLWFGRADDAVEMAQRGLADLAGLDSRQARLVRKELLRCHAEATAERGRGRATGS